MKSEEQAFIDALEKLNIDELSNEFLEELFNLEECDGCLDQLHSKVFIYAERKQYPNDKELAKMVQPPIPNQYFAYDQHDNYFNKPDGSLCGINFMYDHDKDPRLLLACYMLKDKGVLALYESKGNLTIYTKKSIDKKKSDFDLDLPCDSWNCTQYILTKKGWDSA
jgi:hypothetical protein